MKRPEKIIISIRDFVASPRFFVGIVALFIIQAVWIAISSNYPMAFDEDFHMGLIKLYSEHLLPFWSSHPASGDAYGALTRDPSYLYHYILGIVYLPIKAIFQSFSAQIIIFRFINIGLFAFGLYVFRKLLLASKASSVIVNLSLFLFVLIPAVPLLGAQINYDNLIIPITAYALLLGLQFVQSLKKKSFDFMKLLKLVLVCLFGSLVKYAFLPIFLAIVVFILFYSLVQYRDINKLKESISLSWKMAKRPIKYFLVGLILLFSFLAVERYGLNVAKYHKPVPDCGQVLSYDNCKAYGPWIRDYNFSKSKQAHVDTSPLAYSTRWTYGMWLRSYFSVGGKKSDYQSRGPLYLPAISAAVFIIAGFMALLLKYKQIFRRYNSYAILLFTLAIVFTVAILWFTQYQFFIKTTQPVAINGRYLFPVAPLIICLIMLAYNELIKNQNIKIILASVLIVCSIWGGGAMTYILRSQPSWYWSNSPTNSVNEYIKRNVGPVIPGNNNQILFLRKV